MDLIGLIKYSTPLLILGMLLALERIRATLETIREDVAHLKDGTPWNDTCDARHEEINRRFERVETSVDAVGGRL